MSKVIKVDDRSITFDDGYQLESEHQSDCCETHYLSFADLKLEDFDNLTFDLETIKFFEKVEDYGIRLLSKEGVAIPIPGYGYNNGYYSSNLDLILSHPGEGIKVVYDVSTCQVIER